MRKPMIAGNWKMNKTPAETVALVEDLKKIQVRTKAEVVVCPMTVSLFAAATQLKGTDIKLGAQNVHFEDKGAFTGECNIASLKELGVEYVILGHSERRAMGETNADVNAKVLAALDNGLIPIMCVGESLEQREAGITEEWITMQIKLALAGVPEEKIRRIVIAYEPIWAIGTGETATPEQAEEVCQHIRTIIRKRFGSKNARAMTILYGGSMNEKNAFELLAQPDIDGGLIGGASLVPEKFVRIIEDANQPVG